MKKKDIGKIIRKWILPIGVLFLIIMVLLVRFFVVSRGKELEEVEDTTISMVQEYASSVEISLNGIQRSIDTVANYVLLTNISENKDAVDLLKVLCGNSGVYNAVICNPDGLGVDCNGNSVNVSLAQYYPRAFRTEKNVIYTLDDGLTGSSAVVFITPVINKNLVHKYIVCYYDVDNLTKMIKKIDLGNNAFYMLIDSSGSVIAMEDYLGSSFCEESEDYFEYLKQSVDEPQLIEKMYTRIQNSNSDITYIAGLGEKRCLVYAPVGIGRLYLVVGVNQSYIDRELSYEWSAMENMIWQLVVGLVVFCGIIGVTNTLVRIKEREDNQQMAKKADTDLLTGLYNKIATERKIKEYLEENPGEQGLIFVLDIDNFKKINDTMGHAFGDEVLRELGAQIKAEFRASDIIGRTGGDEFIIFLRNMKDETIIRNEANKVERFFKNFKAGEYVKYSATASIGAAVYPRDAQNFESLYKAADQALYVAKKRGKNQLAFYGDDR